MVYRVLQCKCDKFGKLILYIKINKKVHIKYGLILNQFNDFSHCMLFIEITNVSIKKYYDSLFIIAKHILIVSLRYLLKFLYY